MKKSFLVLGVGVGIISLLSGYAFQAGLFGATAETANAQVISSRRVKAMERITSRLNGPNVPSSPNAKENVPFALPMGNIFGADQSSPVMIDMNGDGLMDLIYAYGYSQYVLLNTGNGFEIAYLCDRWSGQYKGDCADL